MPEGCRGDDSTWGGEGLGAYGRDAYEQDKLHKMYIYYFDRVSHDILEKFYLERCS